MAVARIRTFVVCTFAATLLGAQLSEFGETIEVKVINIDAVVTGPDGVPVRGLGADEFELAVDGKPVEIKYYAAIEDGRERADGAVLEASLQPGDEALPYLAIAWDQRSFRPKEAQLVLEGVVAQLPRLVRSTRGVLVARQGDSLGIEQNFTKDPILLEAALIRLSERQVISSSRGERSLIISRLEQAPNPEDANSVEEAQLIEDRAEVLLQEVNVLAQQEQHEAISTIRQLDQLVDMMSNLPRRKSILYISSGVRTRPAAPVYRIWWDKYRSIAHRMAISSVQAESDRTEISAEFNALVRDANSQRVAFYTHDSSGTSSAAASVEFASLSAISANTDEAKDVQQNLLGLATSTGGLSRINNNSVDPLVDDMLRDFRSYYSLGFEATPDLPERGRISLRVRHPDFKVRHFDRFDLESVAGELERAAMTALMTEAPENSLEASIEIGDVERRKNGNYLVPILVKVPISQLALLPQQDQHVGKLSVVVVAKSASGDLSAPAHGEVPIAIDNSEMLAALSRLAGYRLQMQVSPGQQTITIGLRDDVARRFSTLQLVLENGKDT